MEISVRNLQNNLKINIRRTVRIAQRILKKEGVTQGRLSIAFVSSQKMRALNRQYHYQDYSTDVLSFNLGVSSRPAVSKILEGEIIISPAMAILNAKRYKTTPEHECVLYVIHGILHLLGYDDRRPADIQRMRRKEQELLKSLDYDPTK